MPSVTGASKSTSVSIHGRQLSQRKWRSRSAAKPDDNRLRNRDIFKQAHSVESSNFQFFCGHTEFFRCSDRRPVNHRVLSRSLQRVVYTRVPIAFSRRISRPIDYDYCALSREGNRIVVVFVSVLIKRLRRLAHRKSPPAVERPFLQEAVSIAIVERNFNTFESLRCGCFPFLVCDEISESFHDDRSEFLPSQLSRADPASVALRSPLIPTGAPWVDN